MLLLVRERSKTNRESRNQTCGIACHARNPWGSKSRSIESIKKTGDIFFAESDRDWILDGANVHISMVGYDTGNEEVKILDGKIVDNITPDLNSASDLTTLNKYQENVKLCFMGPSPKGPFDISEILALEMLHRDGNPHGKPNSDVIRPVVSGVDITSQSAQSMDYRFRSNPHGGSCKIRSTVSAREKPRISDTIPK